MRAWQNWRDQIEPMEPLEWILNGETGRSSKTIWSAFVGIKYDDAGIPSDPDDFHRCLLVVYCCGWRERLAEITAMYPWWAPMVEAWPEMEKLFDDEAPNRIAPKLYKFMEPLKKRSWEIRSDEVVGGSL